MEITGGHIGSRRAAFLAAVIPLLLLVLLWKTCVCQAAQPAKTSWVPNDPDAEVVVALALDGELLAEGFVARERQGEVYLPLCGLAGALSLAITCADNRAYGFVNSEARPFVTDLDGGFTIATRQVFPIRGKAFVAENDVFVEMRELSRWLPIDLDLERNSSTVRIHPREDLPVQGFKKRQKLAKPKPPLPVNGELPDLSPPRSAGSIPTLDLATQLRLSGEKQTSMQTTTWTSLDGTGDLLTMSGETHLFLEDDKLRRLDMSLYRRSLTGFGAPPLKLTQLLLGAAQAPYLDGIGASARPLYGFQLSNRPLFGATNFLTHDVNGYLPAGWDVELFHNATQIGYQPPSEEGRYHFQNLRVYYGINSFKVVLHGPFGERRESEEVFVSDAITPKGEFFYTVSSGWQTGFTYHEAPQRFDEYNHTVTTDFGITRSLTGSTLLVAHRDMQGAERGYLGVGLRSAVRFTLLSLELIQSLRPDDGSGGQMLTVKSSSQNVLGLNLELVQRFFNNFESAQFPKTDDPFLTRTSLKGNSSFTMWDDVKVPFAVELGLDTRRSGVVDTTSKGRISGGWNGWNLTLEGEISSLREKLAASSSLQVSTRLRDASLRGQIGFAIEPAFRPFTIDLSADKEIGRGVLVNSGLLHDPVNEVTSLRLGISKRYGLVGYSVSATGSTDGAYSINGGVRTSLAADLNNRQLVASAEPLSPYGMVSVRTTVPSGGAERALPGIGYLVNGSSARTVSGTGGVQIIPFLQPDLPVRVTIDLATVEDPFMVPTEEGCRITPRAGVVSLCNFTMVTGGEIDGIVWARLRQAGEVPVKGVRVDLLEEKQGGARLAGSTHTQESGYYLFKGVRPGSYSIAIPPGETARLRAAPMQPLRVAMPVGGDLISGQDFYLTSTAAPPAPPRDKIYE